jgi:hypothetical protein
VSVVSSVFAPPESATFSAASPLPLPSPFSASQEDGQIGAGDDRLGLLGYEAFERFLMDPVTHYDTL